MFNSIRMIQKADPRFQESAEELLQSLSRTLIYTVSAIWGVSTLATAIWPNSIAMAIWSVLPFFVIFSWLVLRILPRHFLIGQLIWQVCLLGILVFMTHLFGQAEILMLIAFLPLLSAITFGGVGGVVMEILIGLPVYWIYHGLVPTPPSISFGIMVEVCGLISGLLGWLSLKSLLTVTQWSLFSLQEAQNKIIETRQHRGQLAHVVKELDHANIRLERANHMLVMARAEAEEAKEARNRFALAISHELRTPLNFIIGFSELMVNSPVTYAPLIHWPSRLYEDIQEIYRSSTHLMRLVNDVLDLGQIENLRMTLIKEWIEPEEVIRETEAMVRPAFIRKGLALEILVEPELPQIFADHTRIRQVLLNLVSNSLRFTDNGMVTLSTYQDENDNVVFAVKDTGIGIAEEDIPKIYEAFHQVGDDAWRQREGTGLGVPISRRFIDLHGGKMWIESQVGKGSQFLFSLPSFNSLHSSVLPVNSSEVANKKYWDELRKKAENEQIILVISPDPTAGDVLATYVDDFSIQTCSLDSDINRIVSEILPSTIFLDQSIAEEPEVITQIHNLPYDLPVFCFTFPGNPHRLSNLPVGVRNYLVKPVNTSDLYKAIQALGPQVHNLLIVDDDPAMIQLIERMLMSQRPANGEENSLGEEKAHSTAAEYHFEVAFTGKEAIRKAALNLPDAVLLDLSLPDISGWEVLKEIQTYKLPVIMITAHDWPQEIGIEGKDAFRIILHRPLARVELAPILKNLLETIKPNYPANLNGLMLPANPSV